jgi:hypothetical protein
MQTTKPEQIFLRIITDEVATIFHKEIPLLEYTPQRTFCAHNQTCSSRSVEKKRRKIVLLLDGGMAVCEREMWKGEYTETNTNQKHKSYCFTSRIKHKNNKTKKYANKENL